MGYDALIYFILPVNNTQHDDCEIDGKQLKSSDVVEQDMISTYTVRICEKTDACHHGKANMVPTEWSLVDFGESHTSAFVRIRDMSLFW